MADISPSQSPAPGTPPHDESKAQRDARLRRERRNAKIQAEGSSRLSKITSLSGRPAAAEAELNRNPPSFGKRSPQQAENGSIKSQSAGDGERADDPAEVDISNMFQRPPQSGQMNEQEMFRQMLRAGREDEQQGGQAGGEEDPMMRIMQQMMASMGGDPNQPGGGLPPGLANMFGGAPEQEQAQPTSAEHVWRIVHAVWSLLLAIYAVTSLSFTGSRLSRSEYATDSIGPRFFWMFATSELVLQTTRFFVDRGKAPPSSMLGKIAGFLPEPYSGYLRVLNRYSIIYTTIMSDALVVVFVLGAFAWWQGLVDA